MLLSKIFVDKIRENLTKEKADRQRTNPRKNLFTDKAEKQVDLFKLTILEVQVTS
jgi:hypothetical protein